MVTEVFRRFLVKIEIKNALKSNIDHIFIKGLYHLNEKKAIMYKENSQIKAKNKQCVKNK